MFASLNEVYGDDFVKKYEDRNVSHSDFTKVKFDKDPMPLFLKNKGYNQEQCYGIKSYNASSMQNMSQNNMGVNRPCENNRIEPQNTRSDLQSYVHEKRFLSPEDYEKKKQLMDKLQFLENELKRYRSSTQVQPQEPVQRPPQQIIQKQENNNIQESFSNRNIMPTTTTSNTQNELVDLLILVVIGFLLIYVFDTIFKYGKIIGARKKIN